jgi:hypothetical protein
MLMFLQNTSSSRRQKESKTACEFFSSFLPPDIKPKPTAPQEVVKGKESERQKGHGSNNQLVGQTARADPAAASANRL